VLTAAGITTHRPNRRRSLVVVVAVVVVVLVAALLLLPGHRSNLVEAARRRQRHDRRLGAAGGGHGLVRPVDMVLGQGACVRACVPRHLVLYVRYQACRRPVRQRTLLATCFASY
jgi:hypothetical protein